MAIKTECIKYLAKEAVCSKCAKKRHSKRICRSLPKERTTYATTSVLSTTDATTAPVYLSGAPEDVTVNNIPLKALIDMGSPGSYIVEFLLRQRLQVTTSSKGIAISFYEYNWS